MSRHPWEDTKSNKSRIGRGMRKHIMERDKGLCRYCGGVAQTIDHVTPRCAGGLNVASNLVAACHPCNNFKGDKTLAEVWPEMQLRPPNWFEGIAPL